MATFVIVAHRNLLSLYDTGAMDGESTTDRWVDMIQLHDKKDFIRSLAVKKRAKCDRHDEGGLGIRQELKNSSKNKSKKKKKSSQSSTLRGKYEIVCQIGVQTLVYTSVTNKGLF